MSQTCWFSSCSFGVIVFLPPVDSGRVFRALFATFLSCSISWSSFLRLCLFCAFRYFPCGFPASSLVPWGLPSPPRVPRLFFGHLLVFVSCLLLFSSPGHFCPVFYTRCLVCLWLLLLFRCSCPQRQNADAFCPFCLCLSLLLLLVVASVVVHFLSYSMIPSLCYCRSWGVYTVGLCLYLIGICSLVSGLGLFSSLGVWGACSSLIAQCP